MLKLKLEIDALRVESFATAGGRMEPGTVRAHGDAVGPVEEEYAITTPQTQAPTCKISCLTCQVSCLGSCAFSCELGCTDGCTAYTCLSGAPVCCA